MRSCRSVDTARSLARPCGIRLLAGLASTMQSGEARCGCRINSTKRASASTASARHPQYKARNEQYKAGINSITYGMRMTKSGIISIKHRTASHRQYTACFSTAARAVAHASNIRTGSSDGSDLRCTPTHAGSRLDDDDSAEDTVRSPSLSSRLCTVSDRERTELVSSLSAPSELVDVSLHDRCRSVVGYGVLVTVLGSRFRVYGLGFRVYALCLHTKAHACSHSAAGHNHTELGACCE